MNRTYTYFAIALSLLFAAPRAAYADFDSFSAPPGFGSGPPMPPGFAPPGMPKPPGMKTFDDIAPPLPPDNFQWSSGHSGDYSVAPRTRTKLHFPGRVYDKAGSLPSGGSRGGGGSGGSALPFNSTFDFGQNASSYAPRQFQPKGFGQPQLPPGMGGGVPAQQSMPAPPMPGMQFFDNGPF